MTKKVLNKELANLELNRTRIQREIDSLHKAAQQFEAKEAEAKAAYVEALALAELGEAGQAELMMQSLIDYITTFTPNLRDSSRCRSPR